MNPKTPSQDGAITVHNTISSLVETYGKLLATQISESQNAAVEIMVLKQKLAEADAHAKESKELHDRLDADNLRLGKAANDLHVTCGELKIERDKLQARVEELENPPPPPTPEKKNRGYYP